MMWPRPGDIIRGVPVRLCIKIQGVESAGFACRLDAECGRKKSRVS